MRKGIEQEVVSDPYKGKSLEQVIEGFGDSFSLGRHLVPHFSHEYVEKWLQRLRRAQENQR